MIEELSKSVDPFFSLLNSGRLSNWSSEVSSTLLLIEEDVIVKGFDENGEEWCLSAKSLFCSLVMSAKMQQNRMHNAHEVDWNTIYVECEKDIYCLISKFAK